MVVLIPENTPLLQRWMASSNPDNKQVWPKNTFIKFEEQLPTLATQFKKPLYRGTMFPWIEGGRRTLKTQKDVEKYTQEFLKAFDKKKPLRLPSITSFTTKKTLAKKYAAAGKGAQLTPNITLDQGFIHIIESDVMGVDIYKRVQEIELVKAKGLNPDDLLVAKEEREVLLLPGTVLIPKSRTDREFIWIAK